MPSYSYSCDSCGTEHTLHNIRMGDAPDSINCPECSQECNRLFNANIFVFKPYKTDVYDGQVREVGSRAERDAILDDLGLTHDTGRYVRKRPQFAVDDLKLEDVVETINSGKLEQPLTLNESGVEDSTRIGGDDPSL